MSEKLSDDVLTAYVNKYIDWVFSIPNNIKCTSLDEAEEIFLDTYTFENYLNLPERCEVLEENFNKAKEILTGLKGKLLCYCCGSPIINAFDESVRKVIDSATMTVFAPYIEEG